MYRQSEKNFLSSNISSTCPHNMVNFGPLAAEIVSVVWGTPGNFNGFRVLAALLHGTLVVGISQTAALNRGRHLYSAVRPSHWALAHILVVIMLRGVFHCAENCDWNRDGNRQMLFHCAENHDWKLIFISRGHVLRDWQWRKIDVTYRMFCLADKNNGRRWQWI